MGDHPLVSLSGSPVTLCGHSLCLQLSLSPAPPFEGGDQDFFMLESSVLSIRRRAQSSCLANVCSMESVVLAPPSASFLDRSEFRADAPPKGERETDHGIEGLGDFRTSEWKGYAMFV